MRVEAADEVFVRARRDDVHPYLVDVAGYGAWWPGARSRPVPAGARLWLRPPRRLAAVQALHVQITRERPGLGLDLAVTGVLDGSAEWYYLDEVDGTRVHYLLHAGTRPAGAQRRLADHRGAVRAGLHTLKDLLETGRAPGAEPHAALLADQRDAIARRAASIQAQRRADVAEAAIHDAEEPR